MLRTKYVLPLVLIIVTVIAIYVSQLVRPTPSSFSEGNYSKQLIRRLEDLTVAGDLFRYEREIRLEGTEIGTVRRIAISRTGQIGVLDRRDLKLFDSNGRFIMKVGNEGEFLRPCDVVFDSNSSMYVLDSRKRKILSYDSAGRKRDSLSVGGIYEDLILQNDRIFLYSPQNMYMSHMAACFRLNDRSKVFEFATPDDFLETLRRKKFVEPMGFPGLMKIYGNRVFIGHPYEYSIREFAASNGEELSTTIVGTSEQFEKLDLSSDFSASDTYSKNIKSFVRVVQVWRDVVLIVYRNLTDNVDYLDVFSLNGKLFNKRSIPFVGKLAQCDVSSMAVDERGAAYLYRPRDTKGPEIAGNPDILVFRLDIDGQDTTKIDK